MNVVLVLWIVAVLVACVAIPWLMIHIDRLQDEQIKADARRRARVVAEIRRYEEQ